MILGEGGRPIACDMREGGGVIAISFFSVTWEGDR